MDAVGSSGQGDVNAAGNKHLGRGRGCNGLNDAAGESGLGGGGKVLLAHEEKHDAFSGEPGAVGNQLVRLWVTFAG